MKSFHFVNYTIIKRSYQLDSTNEAFNFIYYYNILHLLFCNDTIGLYSLRKVVPNVKRNHNNRRIFDERDVEWIRNPSCLKAQVRKQFNKN